MSEDKNTIKPISDLLSESFFIPNYQRGYRWTAQQVIDLLNDINDFEPEDIDNDKKKSYYCLQPLVVKKNGDKWNVVDGQQRLTTIKLIIHYFNKIFHDDESEFEIEYETRNKSADFLNGLKIENNQVTSIANPDENIDYTHIAKAYETINEWFKANEKQLDKDKDGTPFINKLKENTRFIWYELSENADEIETFKNLNKGKIRLTNSELIKAMLLNALNDNNDKNNNSDYNEKVNIATSWDKIEYTLQNDEFWLFIHENNNDYPATRIDFIFDLMCEKDALAPRTPIQEEEIGSDEFKTFRYFSLRLKELKENGCPESVQKIWLVVKKYFQTFEEWHNDLVFYHYIGYLVSLEDLKNLKDSNYIDTLIDKWNSSKDKKAFRNFLKEKIKDKIKDVADLDKPYKTDGSDKTKCKPILLLHNIETVVRQNEQYEESEKYKLPVFYKFPFHLYKKEKWDVEHIDSNTENTMDEQNDQKVWIKYSIPYIQNEELKKKAEDFKARLEDSKSQDGQNETKAAFYELREKIVSSFYGDKDSNKLSEEEKNQIWNFALLDSSTNRAYQNALFPVKRCWIIEKDQGDSDKGTAFIPPCTKNVFLKYYSKEPDNLMSWGKSDAELYKENISELLKEFLE